MAKFKIYNEEDYEKVTMLKLEKSPLGISLNVVNRDGERIDCVLHIQNNGCVHLPSSIKEGDNLILDKSRRIKIDISEDTRIEDIISIDDYNKLRKDFEEIKKSVYNIEVERLANALKEIKKYVQAQGGPFAQRDINNILLAHGIAI